MYLEIYLSCSSWSFTLSWPLYFCLSNLLTFVSLIFYMMYLFPQAAFRILFILFFFFLVCSSVKFYYDSGHGFLRLYPVWFLGAFWVYKFVSFATFEKFSTIISSNFFSILISVSSSSRTPWNNVRPFPIVHSSLRILFISFFFCSVEWIHLIYALQSRSFLLLYLQVYCLLLLSSPSAIDPIL